MLAWAEVLKGFDTFLRPAPPHNGEDEEEVGADGESGDDRWRREQEQQHGFDRQAFLSHHHRGHAVEVDPADSAGDSAVVDDDDDDARTTEIGEKEPGTEQQPEVKEEEGGTAAAAAVANNAGDGDGDRDGKRAADGGGGVDDDDSSVSSSGGGGGGGVVSNEPQFAKMMIQTQIFEAFVEVVKTCFSSLFPS